MSNQTEPPRLTRNPAGRTLKLTLRVNALSNNTYDWANWVEPRVVEAN
jgi:hypothetical protein